ncbi:MAG TPA: SgcJ/EcaC family oxidoreductase [Pseudonocardiaceae bacterium]|nr:SgcJ/EcaC family oxidoreductase [Pseudonocardiaceae bacterium]
MDDEIAVRDAEAYAACFAPDADYVTFVGSHCQCRAAIAACHVPLFTKVQKGSRLDTEITRLRFLDRHIARVHARRRRAGHPAPQLPQHQGTDVRRGATERLAVVGQACVAHP